MIVHSRKSESDKMQQCPCGKYASKPSEHEGSCAWKKNLNTGKQVKEAPPVKNLIHSKRQGSVETNKSDIFLKHKFLQETNNELKGQNLIKLDYDEKISRAICGEVSKISPTKQSVLPARLQQMAEEHGYEINYRIFSPQALASQMGTVLEMVYEKNFEKENRNNPHVCYVRGDSLSKKIKDVRSHGTVLEREKLREELMYKYKFSKDYVDSVLNCENGEYAIKSIHLPDIIVVDTSTVPATVKCAEMKASGQNDTSSVPENVDKLTGGTRNSAVSPWHGMAVTLKKAILLTATKKLKTMIL